MSAGPGPIPSRWLKCPRKAVGLIENVFLPIKTPLDERFDDQVDSEYLWTPQMAISSSRNFTHPISGTNRKIGLWIDLTNTKRFYKTRIFEDFEIQYVKISCKGHAETPTRDQIQKFITTCQNFISSHPEEIIVVHCTHGFNRTGYLISAFLIEQYDFSADFAYMAFRDMRPPGMYKEEYINELFKNYGDIEDAPPAPDRPEWCFESDTTNNVNEITATTRSNSNSIPVFMEGVSGIEPVLEHPLLGRIQHRLKDLCMYHKNGFPGAQPVSMDRDNISYISNNEYKVSWKADGTRYMMLIDGKNSVFFADRDNSIFRVDGMSFPYRKDDSQSLTGRYYFFNFILNSFFFQLI